MLYFANPCGPAVIEHMKAHQLGFIDTPAQQNRRPAGVIWCADNGCFGKGYPADRVEAEQSNKKILDGVRAVAFKPLIEILKGIDQDLLKGAIAGEHFQEQFFADCKDPELAAYVKTLL